MERNDMNLREHLAYLLRLPTDIGSLAWFGVRCDAQNITVTYELKDSAARLRRDVRVHLPADFQPDGSVLQGPHHGELDRRLP